MIIPAILESTLDGFNQKLELVKTFGATAVQVDFCDGIFVENQTLTIEQIPSLPKDLQFEAHLMIESPENFTAYLDKGFSKIIVHYGAFDTEQEMEKAVAQILALGLTPALAINPEQSVSVLSYDIDTISNFTILSVQPGQQGGQFIKESLYRIKELRELAPEANIEVDGGLNIETLNKVLNSGADDYAVGSGIFTADDPKEAYKQLTKLIK